MTTETFQLEKRYRQPLLYLALVFLVPTHLFDYLQLKLAQTGAPPLLLTIVSIGLGFWGGFFVFAVFHFIVDQTGSATLQRTLRDVKMVFRFFLTLLQRSLAVIVLYIGFIVAVGTAAPEWASSAGFRGVSGAVFFLWYTYLMYAYLILPAVLTATNCNRRRGAAATSSLMLKTRGVVLRPFLILYFIPSAIVFVLAIAAPEHGGVFILRSLISIYRSLITALLMVVVWGRYGSDIIPLVSDQNE